MSLVTGSRSRMKIHAKKVLKPDSTVEKEGKTNSVGYTAKQIDETMAELNKIKANPLGKKIIDTLAIQMKSDTPLVQISILLKDLRTELEKQQSELDESREKTERECSTDLDAYIERIKTSLQEVQESEINVVKLNTQASNLKKSLANKVLQLSILEKKEDEIKQLRKRDIDDFEKRLIQSKEVLQALDLVIPKLENIKKDKKELPNALLDLSKIGKANPIDSLVEITSTFDKDAVESIVSKMKKLKDAIQASIADENRYEEAAKANVEILLTEIENTRKYLTTQRNAEANQYEEIKKNKELQERRKENNELDLSANENGRKQREAQCNEYLLNYHSQTARRNEEIELISRVQGIMASRVEIMKNFISESTIQESSK